MNKMEALTALTRILILVTALVTFVDWLRHRDRPRFDIHLIFAALAGIVMIGQLAEATGNKSMLLKVVGLVLFLVHPYLLMRLLLHFRPVGRWVQRAIVSGTVVACASLLVAKRWPVVIGLSLVAFTVIAEGYAAFALVEHARRKRGVSRWKCVFAAAGTLSLALIFLMGGVNVFAKFPKQSLKAFNQVGALTTAVSYLIAFAPPTWLRRSWRLAEMHRFLVKTTEEQSNALDQLCQSAQDAVGSVTAVAAGWQRDSRTFSVRAPQASSLSGTSFALNTKIMNAAWEEKRAVFLPGPLPEGTDFERLASSAGAQAALVVPIATRDWTWGLLIILVRTGALFADDDLALLKLMAVKSARNIEAEELAERQAALLQSAPFALLVADGGGRIVQANVRTEEFFGYTSAELIGRPASSLFSSLAGLEAIPGSEAILLTGRRKDRDEFPASLRRSQMTFEGQRVSLLTVEDVSARKKAEDAVEERTAQLIAANKELEAFSYSVSHDLRAPLRAVDGFSRILEDDYENHLPAEARRYLTLVRENTRKMAALIDDLLAFARLGRQMVQKSRVDMDELVRSVIGEAAPVGNGKPVRLEVGELPQCEGDPALLKQVLVNLISNAVKFSRHADQPVVSIGCRLMNGNAPEYFVRDNGVGFDMAYAPKLFGVFQRLHRAEDYEGTGVGLAIVHRIINRHGGQVWADSRVGEGATFFFTLN